MTWEYFLQTAITPVITAVVVGVAMALMRKKTPRDTVSDAMIKAAVHSGMSEFKDEFMRKLQEFDDKIEQRLSYSAEKNESAHKEFYHKFEEQNITMAKMQERLDNHISEAKR